MPEGVLLRANTVCLQGKPYLTMRILISTPNIVRHIRWLHVAEPVFISIFDSLAIIPAFEGEHVQHLVHARDFSFDCFLLA